MGGFPAARITDPTAHGGMVTMGLPTVLIGGLPAARIGDIHACPMVTVVVPHVGGPFVLGSFTVIVGGMPQSRVTDMLVCVGPPDMLVMGEPTVLVGMMGAVGFMGLMKGLGLAGLAMLQRAVGTAGPSASIKIEGSDEYKKATAADLAKFFATPTGQRWLVAFGSTGRTITITPIPPGTQQNNGFTIAGGAGAYPKADGSHGDGADSTIQYNPSDTSEYTAADGTTVTQPPYQTLGHEMIHGLHNAQGNNLAGNAQASPFDNEEESQTIGVNGHDKDTITERTMSGDAGQSYRPDHDSITRDVYQDSSGQWHDNKTDAAGNTTDTIIPAPAGGAPNH
jgi:uncharacterized Zn-binding protein involved in type VI secretion